jgi:hypothetical protein
MSTCDATQRETMPRGVKDRPVTTRQTAHRLFHSDAHARARLAARACDIEDGHVSAKKQCHAPFDCDERTVRNEGEPGSETTRKRRHICA